VFSSDERFGFSGGRVYRNFDAVACNEHYFARLDTYRLKKAISDVAVEMHT
jgi:hypothetical protein